MAFPTSDMPGHSRLLLRVDAALRAVEVADVDFKASASWNNWRLCTSGQFVYLSGVRESTERGWKERLARTSRFRLLVPSEEFDRSQVPGFIEVLNLVYILTEFFEFAGRLTQTLSQTDTVKIRVGLHGVEGYVLRVADFNRELHNYCAASEPSLENEWEVTLSTLVSSSPDIALDAIRWLLTRFGWLDANVEQIKRDIQELEQRVRDRA